MPNPQPLDDMSLLRLSPKDNIAVLKRPVRSGTILAVSGCQVAVKDDLSMGHKIAIVPIGKGEDVLKYGAPIGFSAQDIAVGEHVHLHNLTSRYTTIEDMEAPK